MNWIIMIFIGLIIAAVISVQSPKVTSDVKRLATRQLIQLCILDLVFLLMSSCGYNFINETINQWFSYLIALPLIVGIKYLVLSFSDKSSNSAYFANFLVTCAEAIIIFAFSITCGHPWVIIAAFTLFLVMFIGLSYHFASIYKVLISEKTMIIIGIAILLLIVKIITDKFLLEYPCNFFFSS